MFETIITALITSLGSSGILTWYFKRRIENKYEQELIAFKHKLELAAAERNIRYSEIFVHTADTIVLIYENLLSVLDAAEDYTKLIQSNDTAIKTKQIEILQLAFDKFYSFYRPKKIYLPKETAIQINELCNALILLIRKHSMTEQIVKIENFNPEVTAKLNSDIDKLQSQIPKLLIALEDDFQKNLGFPIQNKTSA